MFRIGLTGGIGSGKSVVADMLRDLGATIIDTDAIAHALTGVEGAAMGAIRAAFGSEVIRPDGALDRAIMRERVFSDPAARAALQDILHPMIQEQAEHLAARASGAYIVFVVPLLVESGHWRARVDRICVVDCHEDDQRQRVRQRNGLTFAQIARIMQSQATRAQRLAAAGDVIHNGAQVTITQLRAQVRDLHARWQTLAQSRATSAASTPRPPAMLHGDTGGITNHSANHSDAKRTA